MFLKKSAIELFEHLYINQHVINLKNGKKLSNWLIYGLELIELKIFKIYITINLANIFFFHYSYLLLELLFSLLRG